MLNKYRKIGKLDINIIYPIIAEFFKFIDKIIINNESFHLSKYPLIMYIASSFGMCLSFLKIFT